jgi:hypothetical protein
MKDTICFCDCNDNHAVQFTLHYSSDWNMRDRYMLLIVALHSTENCQIIEQNSNSNGKERGQVNNLFFQHTVVKTP